MPWMYDARDEGRKWSLDVRDMAEFAEKVLSYTEGMDQEAFVTDTRTFDAVLRNLELIGEAATHIPQAVRD